MDLKSGIKKLPERQFGSRYPLEDLNRIKQTCDAFHRLDVELIAGMDARSAQPQFRRKVRGVDAARSETFLAASPLVQIGTSSG